MKRQFLIFDWVSRTPQLEASPTAKSPHTSNGWILGRDVLGSGRRAKNTAEARKIVEEACTGVVKELHVEVRRGGCVDEHMSDQLGVFQALTAYCAAQTGCSQHGSANSVVDAGEWKADVR